MIKHKVFREYFLLASVILILTIFLGFFVSRFVAESFRPDQQAQRQMLPPLFLGKTLDNLNYPSKVEAIRAMESFHGDQQFPKPNLVLINHNRQVLFAGEQDKNIELPSPEMLASLTNDYAYSYYGEKFEHRPPQPGMGGPGGLGMPGPGPGPGGPPPGGPGGPHMPRQKLVIKLKDTPGDVSKYFLIIVPSKMREMQPPQGMARVMPVLGIGSLILSLLIGVGLTLFVIYLSVRKKVRDADFVISEIHKGNLKARFAIDRNDEFGQAMLRFNQMADEIEHLVNHLKNVEVSRRKLLQELAHDLRTPIASLKTLLETLEISDAKLDAKTKSELLSLSNKEINYFARLVEDLLVLSQVDEPKYSSETTGLQVVQLLQEEIYDIELKNPTKKINFKSDFPEGKPLLQGDTKLLKRMLRNALENSVSFARSELWVSVNDLGAGAFSISVADNGQGFRPDDLSHFGERRMTRQLIDGGGKGRVSVGLGSVIMKKICEVHGGELIAANRVDEAGVIKGATIAFKFPTQ